MTITFFSNFLNDHQLPFCQELIGRVGKDNFRFVADEIIDPERVAMGFADMNEIYSFVVKSYEGDSSEKIAQELMLNSDVVIIGSCKNMPFSKRMKLNKLTFRYSERILKRSYFLWFHPLVHKGVFKQWTKYISKSLYTLCASAYTAKDLSLFGYPKNKCFKWGYFPIVKKYDNIDAIMASKQSFKKNDDSVSILWVARLIEWKHPEYPILIAKRLAEEGYSFKLNMIGGGPMNSKLKEMIELYKLQNHVKLLGSMPPTQVRENMEQSEIFLFTSDKNEGWGAVLNESLNSGCAVVANKAIGSVPFVLKHMKNGLIYNNSLDDAYTQVKKLIINKGLRTQLGIEGYKTMSTIWNAHDAVNNLMLLIESLNNNQDTPLLDGPCSKACTL